jgi:SGNH domain-containing protein
MRPDLVLVSYSALYPFSRDEWQHGIGSTVKSLSESSSSVVLLRDIPALGFDGPNCLARLDWRPAFLRHWATCQADPASTRADETYAQQRQASRAYPNVATLDMNAEVCPSGICRVVQNGIVSYRDEAHLSTAFARSLSGKLAQRITSSLQKLKNGPVLSVRSLG